MKEPAVPGFARRVSPSSRLMPKPKQPDDSGRFIRASGATGDLRLHELRSGIFRNTRFLRVWLPPGYEDHENEGKRYPVLYLNDGQNLFEASSAFAGVEWQADEAADRLIRAGTVPPLIMVGIDNAGKDRLREYMPHRSVNPMMLRVQGRRYPDFLFEEVMPFVERNYRVTAAPEETGLGGSSLGALIALYTATVGPGRIGRLLLESPSLWVSNRQIIKESRAVRIWPERIFLAAGTAEGANAEKSRSVVENVQELAAIIRRAVLSEKRLRVQIQEGAGHSESAWAQRFPEALQFLYGR
jgi:predicted alpha/beta superfamily hydrolase